MSNQLDDYIGARAAAGLLGVKLQTLYAYTSRGLVRRVRAADGRAHQYARADLERLASRRAARAGHGPVAASALRFGEPVLDSAITRIDAQGPHYRGRSALDLAESGAEYESVAELLWTGALPERPPRWSQEVSLPVAPLVALLPTGTPPVAALALVTAALGARDPARFDRRPEAVLPRARALVRQLAAALALALDPSRVAGALAARSVTRAVAIAAGGRTDAAALRALRMALVLCADHELNASAFAARVAASTGADVYACISAALATLAGPRHGGSADRVEALVAEAERPERAAHVVHERARRGESIPGFGHPLYRAGDPRAAPLLEAARALAPRSRGVRTVLALVEAMREADRGAPNLDAGLVALAKALELPRGAAAGCFAVGRTAGWVAHVLEQYEAGFLLRPRARYSGS